jgi:hypothetical protein
MKPIKAGEPIGLDLTAISDDDWSTALDRIRHDLRSDFIYAPHLNHI